MPSWKPQGTGFVVSSAERILSRTAVSKVTDILYEEFEAFQSRDLSRFEVEYLFLDAIYERLRKDYGMKEGVLCAWGITRQGENPARAGCGASPGKYRMSSGRRSSRTWWPFGMPLIHKGKQLAFEFMDR